MASAVSLDQASDAERRRLEAELGIELIPGTEVMADISGLHFVKSHGQTGNVLVPQPTNNPHDPLNWSPSWKAATIAMGLLFTLTQPFGQTAIGPIFPTLMQEFDITITQAAGFIGTTVLVLGFANFLWVPIAESYGRRVVFIGSLIVTLGASIWHATATSYHSYLGSCILDGLGSGPVETLFPMIIADIVFLNERGKFMTLYMTALFVSLMLSPVVCSAMAQSVGWRNFFWLNVAMRVALIIASIFFMPETKWRRGSLKHIDTDEDVDRTSFAKDSEHSPSKSASEPEAEDRKTQSQHSELQKTQTGASVHHIDMYLGRGRPSKSQFRPWAKREENETLWLSLFKDFFISFKIFFFPIVAFGGFSFSWAASVYGYVNFGQSALFSGHPYDFTVLQVGFTNFACFLGAIVGLATAGPLSDWVSMQATKRNGGIREPEMRLPALIPYLILMVIGEVVASVGADNQWPWEPIVIIGYFFTGIQVAAIPGIAMTYATDCYKPVTGQVFLSATIVKNLWGYGVSQFLNNWNEKDGYVVTTMTNMSLFLLFTGIGGVCLWVWGKKVRGWTRNDMVHRMH